MIMLYGLQFLNISFINFCYDKLHFDVIEIASCVISKVSILMSKNLDIGIDRFLCLPSIMNSDLFCYLRNKELKCAPM